MAGWPSGVVSLGGTIDLVEKRDGAETTSRIGFPEFEHNQWTIEGEIERFGAFARGARRAGGLKRVVATILVVGLIVPMIGGTMFLFVRAIFGADDEPRYPPTIQTPTDIGVTVVTIPDPR